MEKHINIICSFCDKPEELCSCPIKDLIEVTPEDSFC